MDYAAYVEQSAAHVLANHELLMATPSASKLTSFYPTPSESQNTIAQAVCNSGQLTVEANSKNFGGSSDFQISSPNLIDCPHLRMRFIVPPLDAGDGPSGNKNGEVAKLYAGSYHAGWGFDAIERIEVSFPNSNISNLQLTGAALRDWSLLQCKNETERKRLLDQAGKHKVQARRTSQAVAGNGIVMDATVPLSFLFWRSAGGVKGGFAIDGRALNGPIIFRIRFNPLHYFFGPHHSNFVPNTLGTANFYPTASTVTAKNMLGHGGSDVFNVDSFDKLSISMRTYQLMDGAFSVSKALEANPGMVYSIPSLWLNTYNQDVAINGEGKGVLNLNSAPAGMIQAMILRIRPINPAGATGFNRLNYDYGKISGANDWMYRPYVPWSLPLDELKLEYSGQAIFWAQSREELDKFYSDIFQDDLKTGVCGAPLHLSVVKKLFNGTLNAAALDWSLTNDPEIAAVEHETQVLVIPLMHDGNDVLRHRAFENLPHYSGSTLQLSFTIGKNNSYKSTGYKRVFAAADGSYSATQTPAQNEFAGDNVVSGCTSIPSNRMQIADQSGAAETSHVLLNAAQDADGAVAWAPGESTTVKVDVTYIVSTLFQSTNGVAEMQI